MLVALVGEVVSALEEVAEQALVSGQVFVGQQCLRTHACCANDAWLPLMGVALLSRCLMIEKVWLAGEIQERRRSRDVSTFEVLETRFRTCNTYPYKDSNCQYQKIRVDFQ